MKDPLKMMAYYLEGDLTSHEVAELEQWLRADHRRTKAFVRFAMLDCQLNEELREKNLQTFASERGDSAFGSTMTSLSALAALEASADDRGIVDITDILKQREQDKLEAQRREKYKPAPKNEKVIKNYIIPRPLFYGGIAAAIALMAMVFWPQPQTVTPPIVESNPLENVQPIVIASLDSSVDAVWGDGIRRGERSPLLEGEYELTKGLAKIIYTSGAEVILEAPCRFTLESEKQVALHAGKLVGYCPTRHSRGFTVLAPNSKIVDLGTEFGVEVDSIGGSQVHVFEGIVALADPAAGTDTPPLAELGAGHAMRIEPDGSLTTIDTTQSQTLFVRSFDPS